MSAIAREDLFRLSHYDYGEAYFGSHAGMRFRLAREPLQYVAGKPEEVRLDAKLKASVWKEPFSYDKTPAEEITDALFAYTEEGMTEAVKWLNEQQKRIMQAGTE